MRRLLFLVLCPMLLVSCDQRPVAAYAALPALGSELPAFALPTLTGDTLTTADLRGAPHVVALWSTTCGYSMLALRAIDSLHTAAASRGVRVLIVADDGDVERVRQVMDSAGAATPVALADGRLKRIFDQSKSAPERDSLNVQFALPAFLVLDAAGRVVERTAGINPRAPLRTTWATVDSLLKSSALNETGHR